MPILSCPFAASWPDAWQACLTEFLLHTYESHSRSTRTLDNYRFILAQFFHTKSPESVTASDVRLFIRTRKDGRIASASYRNNR